jgi:hypothetical protein
MGRLSQLGQTYEDTVPVIQDAYGMLEGGGLGGGFVEAEAEAKAVVPTYRWCSH